MKDLYTFDADIHGATTSYQEVRHAYARILDRLLGDAHGQWISVSSTRSQTLPALIKRVVHQAEADTGSIGGRLSHEYHLPDQRESLGVWSAWLFLTVMTHSWRRFDHGLRLMLVNFQPRDGNQSAKI